MKRRLLAGEASAVFPLLWQTIDEFRLGNLHLGRRQAGEHRFQIIDDHAADDVHILPDGAGAMGGENRVGGGANGMIGGQRLLGEDVDGGAETPLMKEFGERVEVDEV